MAINRTFTAVDGITSIDDLIVNNDITAKTLNLNDGTKQLTANGANFTGTVNAVAIFQNGSGVLVHGDVDDTPVNSATDVPVSSNWAYDHNLANTGVHGAGANRLLHTGDVDDTPVNTATNVPVSSNWAYDHNVAVTAHGVTGNVVGTGSTQTFTGTNTFNGLVNIRADIDLADNDILRFGSGDDCELFCNGVDMYMDLNAGINNFIIRDATTTRFTFDDNGSFIATGSITATGAILGGSSALRQADVDDTPVNGATVVPVSSNWAYDHAASTSAHGINATNWNAAYTHISSTGADHSYINQNVTTAGTPTFSSIYIDNNIYSVGDTDTYMQFHDLNQWRIVAGGAERLEVSTTAMLVNVAITSTSDITAYSDRRLKTNLEVIEDAVSKVGHLTGYNFDRIDINERQTGIIAQDLLEVLPEAVRENEDGILSISYGQLAGLFVEAIKELKAEIEELKKK